MTVSVCFTFSFNLNIVFLLLMCFHFIALRLSLYIIYNLFLSSQCTIYWNCVHIFWLKRPFVSFSMDVIIQFGTDNGRKKKKKEKLNNKFTHNKIQIKMCDRNIGITTKCMHHVTQPNTYWILTDLTTTIKKKNEQRYAEQNEYDRENVLESESGIDLHCLHIRKWYH